ncbi:hypothetical protein LXA43DRAFT_1123281 [Ganoderma leucocontextum]|nr:hypothetical protein LXA43DRAFT_1123281 [Ganoderma leucocontextum]
MPSFHKRASTSPSSSPSRPSRPLSSQSQTPPSPERDMQLKGVKRIVSGLRRRISSISVRGHRHHDHAPSAHLDPSSPLLHLVPGQPHPVTLPVSPRSGHSIDTLVALTVPGATLVKHSSDPDDSNTPWSHSRSTSADTTSSAASFHEAHSVVQSSEAGSSLSSRRRVVSLPAFAGEAVAGVRTRLSKRFPPPQSLTAPIESLIVHESDSSSSHSRKYSLASFESLTAPLETLVLAEDETSSVSLLEVHILVEPWQIPLPEEPVIEPRDIPIPDSIPHSPCILAMDPLGVSQPELLQLPQEPETTSSDVPTVLVEGAAPVDEPLTSTLDSQLSSSMEISREGSLVSPPAPVGEPEVPNPFIEDSDAHSSDEDVSITSEEPRTGLVVAAAASEIELAPPEATPPTPNVNKAMPPTPAVPSDDEDEEEVPELYLPALTLPTMFLPIPNTDPLSTLLTKYIPPERRPPRDLTGDHARSGGEIHPLVMTNSWRAIARQARDRIVEADPEEVSYIISLWYLRLSSLARMRLFNQTAAECTNLFTVLHAVEPPETRAFLLDRVLPFELDILHAKLKYWAGDHMAYLDALAALLARCKRKARAAAARKDAPTVAMWTERGARVCLIIASQLIEMKDFTAAARVLEPLCVQKDGATAPALRSAVARVYLQGGYVAMAAKHLAAVADDPTTDPAQKAMNAALFASADGDWPRAEAELRRVLAADPENFVAVNNLAVVLLNQGKLKEGIEVLESALRASPATIVTTEPFLFNLATLYELRSTAGVDKKRELLIEVARWAGDGLRTTCLKMPTN